MTKSDSELLAMAQSGDAALLRALSGSSHADAIRDEDGWGLLLTASAAGHAHLVPGLVAAGCRVGSRERDFGRTPLMEAAHKGHWGTVAALLGAWYGVCGGVSLGMC
jgi:ankyrin repeat protein